MKSVSEAQISEQIKIVHVTTVAQSLRGCC